MAMKLMGFFDSIGDLNEQIEFAKSEGLKSVCLSNLGVDFDMVEEISLKKEINAIIKGIEVPVIKIKLVDDLKDFETDFGRLDRIFKICDWLKCKNIIADGFYLNEDKKGERFKEVLDAYSTISNMANKYGIYINVRHNPLTYLNHIERIQDLIRYNDKIKYVYDASSVLKTKDIAIAGFRLLKKNINIVILNDANKDCLGVPIGLGQTKPYEFLKAFNSAGLSPYVVIESNMDYYYKREEFYKKAKTPVIGFGLLFSKELKAIKEIDRKLEKTSADEVGPKYIETIQVRFAKKMIEKL